MIWYKKAQVNLTENIAYDIYSKISNSVEGSWTIISDTKMMSTFKLESYRIITLDAKDVKRAGDYFWVEVKLFIYKALNVLHPWEGTYENAKNWQQGVRSALKDFGKYENFDWKEEETKRWEALKKLKSEDSSTYDEQHGNKLIEFVVQIYGKKPDGKEAPSSVNKLKLFFEKGDVERIGVSRVGIDTPSDIAQYVQTTIDNYYKDDNDEDNRVEPIDPTGGEYMEPEITYDKTDAPALTFSKNWYKKILIAGNVEEYLQSLGATPDIIQFITSQGVNSQTLVNEFRKNPSLTIEQLQGLVPAQQKQVDPYIDSEINYASRHPEISQWILTNFKKIRKGIQPWPPQGNRGEEVYDMIRTYDILYGKIPEIYDWYKAINPEISSYNPEQAVRASDEWHKMIAGKGEGVNYEPTKKENIVYGPKWKNSGNQGWTVQLVTSENDLLAEGNKMDQCVGSYCNSVKSGHLQIYSLRDPDNNPRITIEANGEAVNQIKGPFNETPDESFAEMIYEWINNNPDAPTHYEGEGNNLNWEMGEDLNQIGTSLEELMYRDIDDPDDAEAYFAKQCGLQSESEEFNNWLNNFDLEKLMKKIFYSIGDEAHWNDQLETDWYNNSIVDTLFNAIGHFLPKDGRKYLREILNGELGNSSTMIDYEDNKSKEVQESFARHLLEEMDLAGHPLFDFTYSHKSWYKKAQLEVTDSEKIKGKRRHYTGTGHDINYQEQNKILGFDPNENYSTNDPNIMWIYDNEQIETRIETEMEQTHRSKGNWGLSSHLDKLYTGRYSPSEKVISIISPHEGMNKFREIPSFIQRALRQKFPEAKQMIRY